MNIRRSLLSASCAVLALAGCSNLPKAENYSTALGESQNQLTQDPQLSLIHI